MVKQASPAELLDRTSQRGSRSIGQFFVPFTDVDDYARELKRDFEIGAIVDNIVRAGTHHAGFANQADVEGTWSAGGHRKQPWYSRVYVESSYIARGQQVRMERYCGVALVASAPEVAWPFGRPLSEATALLVDETHRKLANALDGLTVDLRSGVLMIADGVWLPEPDETIAAAPQERCATCLEDIYHSNGQWRHKSTRRAEHLVDGHGLRGQPMKRLEHLADPVEKGKLV